MGHIEFSPSAVGSTVFDPRKLEDHIAKSESRAVAIFDIVQRLVTAGLAPVHETRIAVYEEQHQQAAHMLHSLNGSVANLGAQRVCEVAAELETLLDADVQAVVVEELLNCLEREFTQLLNAADQWLHVQRQRFEAGAFGRRTCELHLQQLKDCLRENNLHAFELVEELRGYLQKQMSPTDFDDFQYFLQGLDFGNALLCLQNTQTLRRAG